MWIRLFIECVNSQPLNDSMTPSPDVTIIDSDMREWTPPEKADILVSELLGNPPLLTSLLHIMYIHYKYNVQIILVPGIRIGIWTFQFT